MNPAMTDQKATVATIAEAKPGDWVWLYEVNKARYDNGVYVGRGVFVLHEVTDETKQSLIAIGTKFDRKTGEQRGVGQYSPAYRAFGEVEKADREWLMLNGQRIKSSVQGCNNATILRAIEALLKGGSTAGETA